MDWTVSFGIAVLLLGLLAGCSTVESRIESDPRTFASLTPADQALVAFWKRYGLPFVFPFSR
jgi:hypothetical protein